MGSNGLHSPLMEMSENGARRRANHPAPARSRTAGSLEFHNFHGGLAPAFRHRANTKVYGGADQVTTALLPDVPRGKECPDHAILMGLPEIKGISLYRSVMIEVRAVGASCVCVPRPVGASGRRARFSAARASNAGHRS